MQKFFRLDNGVRVYLWPWETSSAAISVTLASGSRYDQESTIGGRVLGRTIAQKLWGLNHAYEHVMARATRRYPSWQALSEQSDSTCSDFNAETDKSSVAVYAATDRQHVPSTISYLGSMLTEPLISEANVAFEKERAIEEAREYGDIPSERAALELDRLMFGQDGLAHPILGTEESIHNLTVSDMRNFWRRVVCGQRLIVVVTGNFHPERTEAAIRRTFSSVRAGSPTPPATLDYRRLRGGISLVRENTQQVHCHLGFPLFGINDPRRSAMSILRNHLSSRTSSRIKVEASSRGYGYSAEDFMMHYSDVGQWNLAIPVSPEKFLAMLEIVATVIGRTRRELMSKHDYELALTNLSITAKAKFGSPRDSAIFIGAFMACAGTFTPLRQYLASIRQVTRHQLRRVAQDIFVHARLCLVANGPIQGITKETIRRALRW